MWCLYALTQAPEVQRKLREELRTLDTDKPTMDELSALPYLDAVVRETLRLHAAVPSTIRIAMHDDVIPLNKPYVDKHGKTHDSVRFVFSVSDFSIYSLTYVACVIDSTGSRKARVCSFRSSP